MKRVYLDCLSDFISSYGVNVNDEIYRLIGSWLSNKIVEKELLENLQCGIITKDEFCNVVLAHTFDKFVSKSDDVRVSGCDINIDLKFRDKLLELDSKQSFLSILRA